MYHWQYIYLHETYANQAKLYENYAFPQNFHTGKVGGITLFYAVIPQEIQSS